MRGQRANPEEQRRMNDKLYEEFKEGEASGANTARLELLA